MTIVRKQVQETVKKKWIRFGCRLAVSEKRKYLKMPEVLSSKKPWVQILSLTLTMAILADLL